MKKEVKSAEASAALNLQIGGEFVVGLVPLLGEYECSAARGDSVLHHAQKSEPANTAEGVLELASWSL